MYDDKIMNVSDGVRALLSVLLHLLGVDTRWYLGWLDSFLRLVGCIGGSFCLTLGRLLADSPSYFLPAVLGLVA